MGYAASQRQEFGKDQRLETLVLGLPAASLGHLGQVALVPAFALQLQPGQVLGAKPEPVAAVAGVVGSAACCQQVESMELLV